MNFFNKIKIDCINGDRVRQIWIFETPILQYTKDKNNHKKYELLINKKPKKESPVFYLKFNSSNYFYSLFCLRHWTAIADALGYDYYIICDKLSLVETIVRKIKFPNSNIKFIKSDYSIPKRVIQKVANAYWTKAAYAHLTCFYHAKKNNIKTFFNIDADDTSFYISDKKMAEILKNIINIADEKKYDCYSLDMHTSLNKGQKWNFGVAYIREPEKCLSQVEKYENSEPSITADSFFTQLNKNGVLTCKTFNIENLYFMHWGQWGVSPALRLLQICKSKKLYFPFINIIPNYKENFVNIAENVDILDFGISQEESMEYFKKVMLRKIGKIIDV